MIAANYRHIIGPENRVGRLGNDRRSQYGPRHAAYDLKKLHGKHIICRICQTRRYETLGSGLRAMIALIVLRNKRSNLSLPPPPPRQTRGAHNPKPIDSHYDALQLAMRRVFHELGIA